MEKNKNDIATIIIHCLQGSISEEEMKMLIEWLKNKDENKILFFQIKKIYDLQKKDLFPTESEVQESKERLFSKIKRMADEKNKADSLIKAKQTRLSLLKYTAIAIIAVGLTLGIQFILTPEEKTIYTELNIESAPRMGYITLPDGTEVFLNASTKLRYPDKFEKESREVYLDGEAYFDIMHNEKSPFIVHSSKQKIRVLGTKFNVMDYSDDDYAITTLVTGKINLTTIDETGESSPPILLEEDQQFFYSSTTKQITLSKTETDLSRTWVNKIYHFKNEPLKRIMSRLEKLYGIKISIINSALENTEFTGTFRLGQELEEVLRIINFEKLFTYEIKEDEIFIK